MSTASPKNWRDALGSRYTLCRHEAAHVITAYVHGVPFRYVTTNPRAKGHAAHVMPRGRAWPGEWLARGAVHAAGIIAEELDLVGCYGWRLGTTPTDLAPLRRALTCSCGRTDMKSLRSTTRQAWGSARVAPERFAAVSAVPVDPDWSPVDLAVICWRYAVATLAARWDAVEAVTYALHDSRRALTERDVASIVDDIPPNPDSTVELPEEHARPWFLDYSRLTWETKSAAASG